MVRKSSILGPDGQPVLVERLTGDVAAAEMYGPRALDFSVEASGLTPGRLADIMQQANHGHARAYLTLAIDMEERYLHYASQLQTRRLALDGVTLSVTAPKGVDARAVDLVQSVVEAPIFRDLVQALQDGLGKGFAVVEPRWDYLDGALRPLAYEHRDPRFFRYDKIALSKLCMAEESGEPGAPLERPYFIRHEPQVRAGLPLRRGLARSAAWAFMVQSFTLQDWAAFCEIYGIPLRLGKYGPGATERDKRVLLNAVRAISNDAAAIIPQGMEIEFQEVSGARGEQVFGNLIDYLDRKVSLLVIGQTMTAENGSSLGQAKVHNEVRHDIGRSDARQTASSLNRDLIEPLVAMNFGPQQVYPQLQLEMAESDDLRSIGQFLKDTVPLGLKVSQAYVRKKASIPDPDHDDELLGAPRESAPVAEAAPAPSRPAPSKPTSAPLKSALHAAGCTCGACDGAAARMAAEMEPPDIDALAAQFADDAWEEITDPLLAGLIEATRNATSFQDVLKRLETAKIDTDRLVEKLAAASMIARGLGESGD